MATEIFHWHQKVNICTHITMSFVQKWGDKIPWSPEETLSSKTFEFYIYTKHFRECKILENIQPVVDVVFVVQSSITVHKYFSTWRWYHHFIMAAQLEKTLWMYQWVSHSSRRRALLVWFFWIFSSTEETLAWSSLPTNILVKYCIND